MKPRFVDLCDRSRGDQGPVKVSEDGFGRFAKLLEKDVLDRRVVERPKGALVGRRENGRLSANRLANLYVEPAVSAADSEDALSDSFVQTVDCLGPLQREIELVVCSYKQAIENGLSLKEKREERSANNLKFPALFLHHLP